MDAIRIRHCRLRVLRHGGWSWGANPRQLVDQVTQRLPAWLMQALAEQLADCPEDLTIQSLRLRIPLKLSELRELPAHYEERNASIAAGTLAQRARTSLAAALRDVPRAQVRDPAAQAEARRATLDEVSPTTVIDTLLGWQRAGELPRMLATADAATLRAWARVMLEELGGTGNTRAHFAGDLALAVAGIEALLNDSTTTAVSLARELAHAITAYSEPPGEATAGSVLGEVDLAVAEPSQQQDSPSPEHPIGRTARDAGSMRAARRHALPTRQARRDPVAVESILPFVVIGILSRQKYFEGLRAALICSDLLEQSACFAAALAYKLSPPPSRGWDRSAATRRVAAAMCGLDEPPDNSTMDTFLRGLSGVCAPLDASLWPASRSSRKQPGILVEKLEGELWVALDIASSKPLGWFASVEELVRVADLLRGRLWWLAPSVTGSDLPAALEQRNLRAVVFGSQPRITQRVFDEAREVLACTHSEFIELRPLVLPTRATTRRPAEFSITLALCSALGDLADTLWRARGPTQPLLALRRFADLGGTVSVEESRVLVRPALGRRFMDLSEHGLLRDITGIPWWPGRRVEFAGP